MEKKNNKQQNLITLALGVVAIVLLNVVSGFLFYRFDLTSEKRYTLSETTHEMLDSLDDVVYFEVYLDGDFPQGAGEFKRLRDETRLMLDQFNAWSDQKVQFEFIDPGAFDNEADRKAFQEQLADKGMFSHPETFMNDDGVQVTQLLFPWAVARYHQREVIIPLLGSTTVAPGEVGINHAIEGLEYELSNGMRKLMMTIKPRIAITQGHGEPDSLEINDFYQGLKEYYDVSFVTITDKLNGTLRDTMQNATQIYNKYDAVVMIDPDSAFSIFELFIIDQFIVYGGKALFMVDATSADMDSIQIKGTSIILPRHYGLSESEPGLEEVLYSYGAGLKSEVVEDDYSSDVLIPIGQGQQMQFMPAKWVYTPTITPKKKKPSDPELHPIVRNLDPIKFDFVSPVDTITTSAPIRKQVLLNSSEKSSIMRAPNQALVMMAMYPREFTSAEHAHQPVAVLLEGPFNSYFKQKILPDTIVNSPEIGYRKEGKETKIIVIGDGDVAMNPVYQGKALPLGLDRFNRMNRNFYANKTFLINCANYLLDDKGLLSVRSRVVTLRSLDHEKVKNQRTYWQLVNVLGPVMGILLFGFFRLWSRRRTYGAPVVSESGYPSMMDVVLSCIAALTAYILFPNWIAGVLTFLACYTLFLHFKQVHLWSIHVIAVIAAIGIVLNQYAAASNAPSALVYYFGFIGLVMLVVFFSQFRAWLRKKNAT